MNEADKIIEKIEKCRKAVGKYRNYTLELELKPSYVELFGRWQVILEVAEFWRIYHEKHFWRYSSALKYYEKLKREYGLEERICGVFMCRLR